MEIRLSYSEIGMIISALELQCETIQDAIKLAEELKELVYINMRDNQLYQQWCWDNNII